MNTLENYTGNIKVFNPEGTMLADIEFAKGTNVAAGTFMYDDCGDPIDIDPNNGGSPVDDDGINSGSTGGGNGSSGGPGGTSGSTGGSSSTGGSGSSESGSDYIGEPCTFDVSSATGASLIINCGDFGTFVLPIGRRACGDSTNGPSTGGGEDPIGIIMDTKTLKIHLNNLLEQDPFKLVEIDCDQIENWKALAQHTPDQAILDKIQQIDDEHITLFGDFDVQDINDAEGPVVNMDYFPVVIDRLPNNPTTGQQFTGDEFLEYIRTNMNDFVNTNYSSFNPSNVTGINEAGIWFSNNPLGAIISIDIPGAHDGSVVCSKYNITSSSTDNDHWVFTTLEMPWGIAQGLDGPHPVSGNREFGYSFNPNDGKNGSYIFYARGVDRMESKIDWEIANQLTGGTPFNGADNLWLSFQQKVQNFTNNNGGVGNTALPSINRPDWEKVKEVFLGVRAISDLGCD